VTAEDVKRFADTYLDPSRLTVVMVATPDTVKSQLAGLPLGPVEVRSAPPSAGEPAPGAKPAVKPAAKKAAPKKAAGAARAPGSP
jgi:predicted Zn-dependent peptidase